MEALTALGLGLDYGAVRLERTPQSWVSAGSELRDWIAERLGGSAMGVEQIGSTSVAGLMAKPIIDLAVGLRAEQDLAQVRPTLRDLGWIYRGDAGTEGGHVFVLEARPWHRVAHLHAVLYGGQQWLNYRRLRDVLRTDANSRSQYESEKLRLAAAHPSDHRAYGTGKTRIVTTLLSSEASR